MSTTSEKEGGHEVAVKSTPLPGYPEFRCSELNEDLAEALIARTLDSDDVRLREMTRDLARFSSKGQLARWRPGRNLLCLHDAEWTLLGVGWVAAKPLPERDDYFDPEMLRECAPRFTCAIRTYGAARGRGLLTKAFAERLLDKFLREHPEAPSLWYETKTHNTAARALARQIGFTEVSGEAGSRVVGVRFGQ